MQRLIYTLAIINSIALSAADYKTDTIVIPSLILNEPRDILIYEPPGLHRSDSVCIFYLLDGEYSKYRYDKIANEHFSKPVIGIGIINTNRNRDMLPVKQPDKFLDFIDKELIPAIEKNYTVAERILFGHSFAGGFAIYAMIHKPGLFDKYIASSPTPIMKMVDTGTYLQLNNQLKKPIEFYFSCGSKDMKQVKKWSATLRDNLTKINLNRIAWKHETYEGGTHNSTDVISLIKGFNY
jgi:enterochelin esterase-like enzyme